MGKLNLSRGDVKRMKILWEAQYEKRRCKNDENTMGKFILRRGDVKTMKKLWVGKLILRRGVVKTMKILWKNLFSGEAM